MKKFCSLILTLFLILATLTGCRSAEQTENSSSESGSPTLPEFSPEDDFEYWENEDGTLTITGYLGIDADISIPETINGVKVTKIENMCFNYDKWIVSVKIPKTVTTIGAGAFSECIYLTTVVLSEGVETIQNQAFEYCINLSEITLPSTLSSIGSYAFLGCSALKDIRIPKSVTEWGWGAFNGSGLEAVEFEEGLEIIGAQAFNGTKLQEVVLPESVKEIEHQAFASCFELERITLNEGLVAIGDGAFRNTKIAEIVIPSTVKTVTEGAFGHCDYLKAVRFEGDAPETFEEEIEYPYSLETSYTIYYHEGAKGFTSPEWFGYPTEIW